MLIFLPVLLLASAAPAGAQDGLLPEARPTSRYEEMMATSPFVLATPPDVPVEKKESFAANWYISGMARLTDPTGVEYDTVAIRSRDGHVAFELRGNAESNDPDAKGVSIASVQRIDKPRKSTVMLRKGSELAKVEYSEANNPAPMPQQAMNNRGAQMPQAPRIGPPPGANGAPGAPVPGGVRTMYNPNPGMNPLGGGSPNGGTMIPNNSSLGAPRAIPPGMTAVPGANGDTAPKRRVRVINSQ